MSQSGIGLQPPIGIPSEAFRDEVDEKLVVGLENLSQRFTVGSSPSSLCIHHWSRGSRRIEKQSFPGTALDQVFLGNPQDFHNTGQLFLLVLPREDRVASVEFSQDAP